jgi:hypothetical protein
MLSLPSFVLRTVIAIQVSSPLRTEVIVIANVAIIIVGFTRSIVEIVPVDVELAGAALLALSR